ncbi:hypothetical protein J3A83DRAFT_4358888 [Scleroderma citrinum]
MLDTSRQAILSIYRNYLREVSRLPHIYLRQFYKIQGSDTFRALLRTKPDDMKHRKLKRILKASKLSYNGLRRLQLANSGNHIAFNRMLDVAYGRVGKLRYELLEPLLSRPGIADPPSIVVGTENRPLPVYSPELSKLLTSSCARKNPLRDRDFVCPSTLPERADPRSEDASVLGPLSKRREVNIHWRYFSAEWKKVLPPLQVSVEPPPSKEDSGHDASFPRPIGFEETNLLQQVLDLAGCTYISPPSAEREHNPGTFAIHSHSTPFDSKLPVRWLRRRYRELLGRLPILTYHQAGSRVSQLGLLDEEDKVWLRDTLSSK